MSVTGAVSIVAFAFTPSAASLRSRRRTVRGGVGRSTVGATLAALVALASTSSVLAVGSNPGAGAEVTALSNATTEYVEGIDVSHWQGVIDWPQVAAAGKRFAILKATDGKAATGGGLFVDPNYATNHAAARSVGLWTGAYHFARPDATAGDAVREADHFADRLDLGSGDLIPALDLEVSGGLLPTALTEWTTAFLDRVTVRIGARPMIYTSPNFWKTAMADTRALADAGYQTLWIAHWNATTPSVPAANWGGHGWTFWQYSNCGSVPGIGGCVDLDRYRGLDLSEQAYSIFRLASSSTSRVVKQGASSTALVDILRTNFASDIALDVTGLPDGTTAEFAANPTSGSSGSFVVRTPEDPTATPLGTYPLTITGTAEGITSTTIVNLVVADGIAPTVVAPVTSIVSKTVLGTSSVPVRVSWSASDPSGIGAQGLQRSLNGGAWSTVKLASATATSATESLPFGGRAQQRARATDRLANTSAWQAGPVVRTMLTQQGATSITYRGTWRTVASKYASGGSVRYATSAGASATYRFSGSSVGWVAARGPGRGSARVYVDGVYAATINLSSATGQSRAIVFARNWAVSGAHTLRIVVVGTAGHPRVDLDAFVRLAIS